jgi:hypothetical protein
MVGHTADDYLRASKLIPHGLPRIGIFNGSSPTGHEDKLVANTPGRDIAMYYEGVRLSEPNTARFVFLNDDVQHISHCFWNVAKAFLAGKIEADIIGVANLSSWADHDSLPEPQKSIAARQGTDVHFIRTSAFMATRGHFLRVYALSNGDPQVFEKSTLADGATHMLLPPVWAYDRNIASYV